MRQTPYNSCSWFNFLYIRLVCCFLKPIFRCRCSTEELSDDGSSLGTVTVRSFSFFFFFLSLPLSTEGNFAWLVFPLVSTITFSTALPSSLPEILFPLFRFAFETREEDFSRAWSLLPDDSIENDWLYLWWLFPFLTFLVAAFGVSEFYEEADSAYFCLAAALANWLIFGSLSGRDLDEEDCRLMALRFAVERE